MAYGYGFEQLLQYAAGEAIFLHQCLYFACPEILAFYPQYAVAVMDVEIDAAAGEMVAEKSSKAPGLGGILYVGFKDFYH
jgi:hypothetical protein